MNDFNLILFIFLLIILLIATAILISYIVMSNKINITGGSGNNVIDIYKQLASAENSSMLLLKLKNGKIIIRQNNFSIKEDSIIRLLTYGSREGLIGNFYILLNILNILPTSPLGIIIIGKFIIISSDSEEYLNILTNKLHLQDVKIVDKSNGMCILKFAQKLQYGDIDISTLLKSLFKIIGYIYDETLSEHVLMYKLMDILMGRVSDIKKGGENGGETSGETSGEKDTTIVLNDKFISEFKDQIINEYETQASQALQAPQAPQESLHTKFMRELVANNRNVEIISAKPHTENMKKGTMYFLPKKNTDISIFAELGINNNSIPLGVYYINNSQNVIKIE